MIEFDEPLSADAERARAALGMLSGAPAPRAEFRARLKRDFAAGALAAPAQWTDAPARAAAPARGAVLALPARRFARAWAWGLAAAAAALAVVFGVHAMNQGPSWRLASATGEGVATVDGRPIPIAHTAELESALVPGARVRVPPGCQIELASRHTLAIQMAPETDATVPALPGRWFGRSVTGEIQSGEWRITSGSEFAGAMLTIVTPEAHVEVTGTTLAVICEPQGTCVCVHQGSVRVGRDRSDMVRVEQGRRRYLFADETREPENEVMRATEETALPAFEDSMEPEVGGR